MTHDFLQQHYSKLPQHSPTNQTQVTPMSSSPYLSSHSYNNKKL